MQPGNDHEAPIDYSGTCETRTGNTERINGNTVRQGRSEPTILVELVIVDGTEGQKLHSIQAEIVRRVLARLAERQTQTPQKESRL